MKALSIRHPWAWAIINAGKDIENRDWRCDYRGEILIHASKLKTLKSGRVPAPFVDDFDAMELLADMAGIALPGPITYRHLVLQSGAIIGRARIVDCVPVSASPWFCGPWGFVLADVEPTPVIPCKGALGLWDVPASVLQHLKGAG